jgi:hypothetical protein
MAVDNVQSSSSAQQSSTTYTTTYVTNTDASARKRAAIGLDPERETAPDAVLRPPDDDSRAAHWLLVLCLALLGLAVLLLILARFVSPNTTLSSLFGRPAITVAGPNEPTVAPANLDSGSSPAPYLRQLPGFRLWLTDDFGTPSQIAAAQAVPGQVDAAVVSDAGVYRMQVSPNQVGWTLFDLAGVDTYQLETSATVSAETPEGSAGLLARFNSPGNFYMLTVDGSGNASVQLWSDGQPVTLQSQPAVVNPAGQNNRLWVEDDGNRLRFYVNQAVVSEIVEPLLPPGRPGIAAVAPGAEAATVDFDWIAIYRPE